jgi:ATP-binding cassette, subfamily C (CFTR/MRP), member 1
LVLDEVNVTIAAKEKVGIVGRTGAGKSSLVTAILRLVELDGGRVMIDGVDASTIGLRKLRSSVAVIPQVRPFTPTH